MSDPRLADALFRLEALQAEFDEILSIGVRIDDLKIFDRLFVEQLHRYVTKRGWGKHPKSGNRWEREDESGALHCLVIPRKNGFGDHAVRFAQAVEIIAEFEGRTQLQVLVDVKKIRVDAPQYLGVDEGVEGTHPLDSATGNPSRTGL